MSAPARVVIVGASVGGVTAAETLRHEGFEGEVIVLGSEARPPYLRPPLSKQVLQGDWQPEDAMIRSLAEFDDLAIDLKTSCRAIELDVSGRRLLTTSGVFDFDEAIIATGTQPRRLPTVPHGAVLRTVDDALALRDGLRDARRVAVVGAGILGSEVASASRKYGAETLLVGRSGSLGFGGVGVHLSSRLIELHQRHGVDLETRAEVIGSDPGAGVLRLAVGGEIREERVDIVAIMVGGSPRTEWLTDSGLDLRDGIGCDRFGVAAPGVSAVGDVAAWWDPVTSSHRRVEHQTNAIEQAVSVATRIVTGTGSAAPVPFFWSEVHGVRVSAYGWFAPGEPLTATDGQPEAGATVFLSRDASGQTRGVVGWNAAPRDFRAARLAVDATAASAPSMG